jgi:GNAT superfamily N-acetyltransferase
VNDIRLPVGFRLERLRREHPRRGFRCGEAAVDSWPATKALQHQAKHLSVTKVLLDAGGPIAGYYTLATGQVDFSDLPIEVSKHLPRRVLPIATLAWLGVTQQNQGQGLGRLLLAQALRDCWEAGNTFPFVAVIVDCINQSAKGFYRQWNFAELPGHPFRLFLSAKHLDAMMQNE